MFQKKKGFTLIELLAVIVILAVIALIATPLIMNVINDAKKNSFKDSAYGIMKAVQIRVAQEQIDATDGQNISYKLNVGKEEPAIFYSGELPDEGWAYVDVDGKVQLYIETGDFKAYYDENVSNQVQLVDSNNSSTFETIKEKFEDNGDYENVTELTLDGSEGGSGGGNSGGNAPDPVAFGTDSWATINQAVKSNNISAYNVGDTKEVTLDVDGNGEDETYHIMVVNTTECTTETSETACGLVLQFQEPLNITNSDNKKMNSTNTSAGGWPETAMRTYLNGDVYNKLKAAIGDIIVETKAISGHEKNKTENYPSQDYLYLLSTKEVGINTDYDTAKAETRKLDYYSDNASRIKYNYGTTTAGYWWLRAAYSRYTTAFYNVSNAGSSSSSTAASNALVVVPAFRVGK